MKAQLILSSVLLLTSCATTKGKILLGGAGGGVVGTLGGMAFSPNEESKVINGVVFGLGGVLVGAALTAVFLPNEVPKSTYQIRDELDPNLHTLSKEGQGLPAFIKNRMTETVVEEVEQKDFVSEDGTLHSPHKVYRIIRAPELYARPEVQK